MQPNGKVVEDERIKFIRTIREMRENKHFKEFFLRHEKSLEVGMTRLDAKAAVEFTRKKVKRAYDHFTRLLTAHMLGKNKYRKQNEKEFADMKDSSRIERNMS
mmetsp:Transcript_37810/g.49696  ORF Transcript_37810/g.49696 Transcript_37810/m.49696 type:complete len:103 (+) Transcript_37810:914-1222(+)|eukprot:CAMPEP_0185598596 /NCGR_PEP_ID=MMETSP0434-20130131/82101_1 /TAXON_ID=626734 ORGANISM="Favella taraikaensis, Strain Fe Narragansett Bay" /NCGR_SAMPLE_ID=MMETSP0434 /ASSEMBLY_ACC=CAM_ASM_000379 /LENGTH=102 /DNA_ID=CAMNT_0028227633 /DNA_START=1821 /DNA_END=2129 /DNA_ORIENTATION=-